MTERQPLRTESPGDRPRWVRVAMITGLIVALVLIILMFAGGHGPWTHMGSVRLLDGLSMTTAQARR
jgi:hypothetical protein